MNDATPSRDVTRKARLVDQVFSHGVEEIQQEAEASQEDRLLGILSVFNPRNRGNASNASPVNPQVYTLGDSFYLLFDF